MKKRVLKYCIVALIMIFATLAMVLSVRGRLGTPDPAMLATPEWKENGPFELSPERGRYTLLYSLIEYQSPFFSVELARFVTPDLGYKNDHFVSLFAPGISYLAVGGYLVGRSVGAAQVGSFSVIALFGVLNLLLIYKIVGKLGYGRIIGFLAGFIFLFATPSFAYAVTLYQHHVSTFLILSALYLTLSYATWWSLSLIWFLCATSIPVDYPNLFLMLPIGLYNLAHLVSVTKDKKPTITLYPLKMLTLLGMTLPIVFFLMFNNLSYGSPFQFSGTVSSVREIDASGQPVFSQSDKKNELTEIQDPTDKKSAVFFFKARYLIQDLYIHLMSPDRGVIYFTPVIILGVIGAFLMYAKHSQVVVLITSVALLDLLLYSMWGDPWGGWAFGSRYLIPAYAVLSIFLGSFLDHFRKNMFVLLVFLSLAGYSIYVNAAGALSSNANPPKVQVLELEKLSGRRERYSFDRNIEYLQAGNSKSFAWQTWLKYHLSAWDYYRIIAGSITTVIGLLTIALYVSRDKHA